MCYIAGIDPGFTGAVVVLDADGHFVIIEDAPTLDVEFTKNGKKKIRKEFNIKRMRQILTELPLKHVLLEAVTAGSGQGVTSMFRFGHGLGLWEGLLCGLDIPYSKVLPAVWKEHFGLISKDKDASVAKALELSPTIANYCRLKKHHGRADAYLIAQYDWTQRNEEDN